MLFFFSVDKSTIEAAPARLTRGGRRGKRSWSPNLHHLTLDLSLLEVQLCHLKHSFRCAFRQMTHLVARKHIASFQQLSQLRCCHSQTDERMSQQAVTLHQSSLHPPLILHHFDRTSRVILNAASLSISVVSAGTIVEEWMSSFLHPFYYCCKHLLSKRRNINCFSSRTDCLFMSEHLEWSCPAKPFHACIDQIAEGKI